MTDQITIPRETFDQMQRALEVLNHLDADINFLNTKELEEMVDKALSAAKEVDHMPDAGKMVQPKLGVAVGELASPEYDQLRAKVQPTAMPFVPWSKEAEMLESWAVQPQAQGLTPEQLWHLIGEEQQKALTAKFGNPQASEPEKWKLVPVEPTPNMVSSGAEGDEQFFNHAKFVYGQMLAAAPEATK